MIVHKDMTDNERAIQDEATEHARKIKKKFAKDVYNTVHHLLSCDIL